MDRSGPGSSPIEAETRPVSIGERVAAGGSRRLMMAANPSIHDTTEIYHA